MVSLETLLRQLVVAISGRERIHVQMWTEGDYPLPLNVKTAVYRIAQEVFNNIAKHSEATEVLTILKLRSDGLTLDIADNGKGFLTSQESSKGMGLRIMQERAALIGARIDIASEPAQGTVVNVTWGGNQKEIINGVSCSNPTDDCG
jgi:signal transduction histidine kinase